MYANFVATTIYFLHVVKNYVNMCSGIIIKIIMPLIGYSGELHYFLIRRKNSMIGIHYVVKAKFAKSLMR